MRLRILCPILLAAMLLAPAAANAYFPHVVSAGESLTSVAAADGLSISQLAAANGISSDSQLIAGSTLQIPPQSSAVGVSAPVTSSAPVSSTSQPTSFSSSSSGGYLVQPGDTLSAIAARDGVSVSQLAAANGLDPNGLLLAGSTLSLSGSGSSVSTPVSSASGSSSVSSSGSGGYVIQPGDTLTAIAARSGMSIAQLAAANGIDPNGFIYAGSVLHLSGSSSSSGSSSEFVSSSSSSSGGSGGYVVQPGDTLSAIAARSGLSVSHVAAINGLDPNGILPAGATISLPGAGAPVTTVPVSTTSAETQPVGTPAQGNPSDPPYPTPERVNGSEISSIAAANGVPSSLAEAIGWQESGWNNDLVSSADARGVMQILPGTWDWIQRSLTAGHPLAPASAADNVRGGVLLLRSLLNSTGGDPAMAAAGYYQGLSSVQQHGMYSDTQQYVRSVSALEQRFGGG
jgi:LysM repeat protein